MNSTTKKPSSFSKQVYEIIFILLIVFLIRTFFFGLYQVPTGSMETTMLVGERFFADKFTYHFWSPKRNDIISLNSPLFEYSNNWFKRLFQEYVWGPDNVTKRIIGIPGDLVEGNIEDNRPVVYVNGQKLDEPYLNKYPLIATWKESSNNRKQTIDFKSYDPALPYDHQPFYRIRESQIYKDETGNPYILMPQTLIKETETQEIPTDQNFWNGSDVFRVKLGTNQYWLMGDNRLGSRDCRDFGPIDGHLIHGRILFRIMSIDPTDDWLIFDLLRHPIDFWSRVRWNRFFQFLT